MNIHAPIAYLSIITIVLAGLIFLGFQANANGIYTIAALTAKKSQQVTVGPDSNIQVLATTTSRSYASIGRDNQIAAVYCTANGDIHASAANASFKLATNTVNIHEIHLEKNPYDGAVRCTASASTTLNVYELRVR